MAQDEEQNKPILPPPSRPLREVVRAIIEATASFIPGGGALARLYRTTHPPVAELDRAAWQSAVSNRTNEHTATLEKHEALISPTVTLGGEAANLARVLAKDCPDGLAASRYSLEDLQVLMPGTAHECIRDAVYELKKNDLLSVAHSTAGMTTRLRQEFYEQLDCQVMGWDTTADAKRIAKLMLENDCGSAPELHKKAGWSKRRFNPAFSHIVRLFPEGRIRRVYQTEYCTLGVVIAHEDRVALRQLVDPAAPDLPETN